MYDAILILEDFSYNNTLAIENTINYILRLDSPYHFYYGIWPETSESAVSCLEQTRSIATKADAKKHKYLACDRKVQHLILSFPTCANCPHAQSYDHNSPKSFCNYSGCSDKALILEFSHGIAQLFSQKYQLCWALHEDNLPIHTHFVISTTSYLPNTPPLISSVYNLYIKQIQELAKSHHIHMTIITKGEK